MVRPVRLSIVTAAGRPSPNAKIRCSSGTAITPWTPGAGIVSTTRRWAVSKTSSWPASMCAM